jgi:hypothetical protein
VIEEGPLADWLWRNLGPRVEEMVICEPHLLSLIITKKIEFIQVYLDKSPIALGSAGGQPNQNLSLAGN